MLAAHYSRIRVSLCRLSAGAFSHSMARKSRLPAAPVHRYFAIGVGPLRSGSKPSARPLPSNSFRRSPWDEKDAGPDQLDEEKERPSEPTPKPANLRLARLEPDFRINEQPDAFTRQLRSNSCHFDTYVIDTRLESQATVCWRPFPYPWTLAQVRDQIPVSMGTAVTSLRQCRIRKWHFQRVR